HLRRTDLRLGVRLQSRPGDLRPDGVARVSLLVPGGFHPALADSAGWKLPGQAPSTQRATHSLSFAHQVNFNAEVLTPQESECLKSPGEKEPLARTAGATLCAGRGDRERGPVRPRPVRGSPAPPPPG